MRFPNGKTLVQDEDGKFYIVSRQYVDGNSVTYLLLRCKTEVVDSFRYKYEAIAAVDAQEDGA